MCGEDIEITDEVTVCECPSCGTKQTVPVIDDDKKINLYARANRLRAAGEFDKAAGIFQNIVDEYNEDAEGYWGLVLCKYGIQYVDDPDTGKKVPACHRASFDSIMDDENFDLVMENSDPEARALYREDAKFVEDRRKEIIKIAKKEEPYDIFICYKENEESGERTEDSIIAESAYRALIKKGYRVFFAEITLGDMDADDDEPYVFAALNSSKVMLAFGTSYDNYYDVWVKNNWNRFLELMDKDKSKVLLPCFKDVDKYDIPKEFGKKITMQDMGEEDSIAGLLEKVVAIIPPSGEAGSNGIEDASDVIGETEPLIEDVETIEETDTLSNVEEDITSETVVEAEEPKETVDPSEEFVKQGFLDLDNGDWSNAENSFNQAIGSDSKNARAYWGAVLAQFMCKDKSELGQKLSEELIKEIKSETVNAPIDNKFQEFSQKYFIMQIFSDEDIDLLFNCKLTYRSKLASIKDIIEKNDKEFILDSSEYYTKAFEYADDEVRSELVWVKQYIVVCLEEMYKIVQLEDENAKKATDEVAIKYYEKLEHAFDVANKLALDNKSKNETRFKEDHDLWEIENEKGALSPEGYQKLLDKYEQEYEIWQNTYRDVFDKWNEEKVKYAEQKNAYLKKIEELEDEKRLIEGDGFMARRKKAEKDKEIMQTQMDLRRLVIPREPIVADAPQKPTEAVERPEPVEPDFEELINIDEVIEVFNQNMI